MQVLNSTDRSVLAFNSRIWNNAGIYFVQTDPVILVDHNLNDIIVSQPFSVAMWIRSGSAVSDDPSYLFQIRKSNEYAGESVLFSMERVAESNAPEQYCVKDWVMDLCISYDVL